MEVTRINVVDRNGITFVYQLCGQMTDLVKLKEDHILEIISSDIVLDTSNLYSKVKELSDLYSNLASVYHELARKVALEFRDITKTSEYLVVLSRVLQDDGVKVDKRDFDNLISNSFDLYVNISDFLSGYQLFSDKYQKLVSLLSMYKESIIDSDRFVENLKSIARELAVWKDDLWRFVREIYERSRVLEESYNHVVSKYGLEKKLIG